MYPPEHQAKLPKHNTNFDLARFSLEHLTVITESEELNSLHPCRVRTKNNKTYFLKGIDATQPHVTERELKIVVEIEEKGLHQKINIPRIHSLVRSCHKPSKYIEFLLANIATPTPLTQLIHEDTSQRKRENWEKEVQRDTDILHEHEKIRGDAKADNLVLDAQEKL